MTKLEEGDIIELKEGHTFYAEIPEHFIYDNRRGIFDELAKTAITIGEDHYGLLTDWFAGTYVVVRTSFDGGGGSSNDPYPNGHHVFCERLNEDGTIGRDGKRFKCDFYQSGSFTAMNGEIPVIRKATKHWEMNDEELTK